MCSWHHDCVLLSLLNTPEWKSFHGRVIGVNFYTLPNLCEISPEGPSPSCHLGDGYTDLVIVKECSRLQMNSHIQRNFNSKDQVSFCFNFSPFLRTVGTIIFIQIFCLAIIPGARIGYMVINNQWVAYRQSPTIITLYPTSMSGIVFFYSFSSQHS